MHVSHGHIWHAPIDLLAQFPFTRPYAKCAPKDGDLLAVLSVVLRSVVIFTVAAEQVAFQDLWDLQCLHCFFCREAHRILWVGLRQATLQFFLHLVVSFVFTRAAN